MRFIGNKEKLLPFIHEVFVKENVNGNVFCDIFTGTTNVAKFYKEKGLKIISNDLLEFSYVFQFAYIFNNEYPKFEKLLETIERNNLEKLFSFIDEEIPLKKVIHYLNSLEGEKGFIYENYCEEGTKDKKYKRMYFSSQNAMKIDKIRNTIQNWFNENLITKNEFYILLASLIETISFYANISGTYGAFLKNYDPRAIKPLILRIPQIIKSNKNHEIYKEDANKLIKKISCDILYLDPPYNERQYLTNYHILEIIAKWDNPKIIGKTGLPLYKEEKSKYCIKEKVEKEFKDLIENANCKYILFSYNNEGIMREKKIIEILKNKGELKIYKKPYRRFRSDSDNNNRKYKIDEVNEIIYFVKVN